MRSEKVEKAARAWSDAMDRWRGPQSDTDDGWEKCSREADDAEVALRAALALPPDPAPGPDRYAEGWRAGVEAAAREVVGDCDLGEGCFCAETATSIRSLPVPEPAHAGKKEGSNG